MALEGNTVRMHAVVDGALTSEVEGAAVLRADTLIVGGGESPWSLPFKKMKAISIEFGGVLQIRTGDALYQLEPLEGSPLKWRHFLAAHHAQSRSRRRGRR